MLMCYAPDPLIGHMGHPKISSATSRVTWGGKNLYLESPKEPNTGCTYAHTKKQKDKN